MLVLSVRLWGKLFMVSEFFGKQGLGQYMTVELVTKSLVVFFICYYILAKVFTQMIFRARVSQNGAALMPYWYPFVGNFVACAKSYLKREKEQLGKDLFTMLPFDHLSDPHGRLPAMYGVNTMFGDGLLVFNTCQSLDLMLIKNAKLVDKCDDIPRILNSFGGRSFVFVKNSKEQAKTKKFVGSCFNEKAFKHFEKLLRKLVLERLSSLQSKVKEGKRMVRFNITEEIIDTVGVFVLKAAFGETNVSQDEKVRIYIDGVE